MLFSIQAILLSRSGSRRQLSIDNHNRQRGSDEPHAPLLLEGDDVTEEGEVVIGGKEGDQADHDAAGDLKQATGLEPEAGRGWA
jgi:hypothetical protein